MKVYEARPKGAGSYRHEKALKAAGFVWTGSAWLREGAGPRPWGCTVRAYTTPVDRSVFGRLARVLAGKSEFGR